MATPKKYTPTLCEKLIEHMTGGYSFASFGAIAGVTKKTLYEWAQQYPEFLEAKGIAELHSLKFWEGELLDVMRSPVKGWPASAWIFSMKARFKKFGYRDDVDEVDPDETSLQNIPTATLLRIAKGK